MFFNYIISLWYKLKKIHIHKWKYTKEVFYNDVYLGQVPDKEATRTCKICRKSQYLDVYCLGMNPEKYTKTWLDR